MKKWLLLALVLAVIAVGVWGVWYEDDLSIDQESTAGTGETSQLDSALLQGAREGTRDATKQLSDRGLESELRLRSDSSQADDPLSKERERSSRPAVINVDIPSAAGSSTRKSPEDLVIGGMVMDEEGNPLGGIEVLAKRVDSEESPSTLFDQLDEGVLSIFSDFSGTFLFRGLEEGTYHLRIAPAEGVAADLKTVRVGLLNVNLVVVLLWDIRVFGTVSNTEDKPLQNVQVTAGRQSQPTSTGLKGEYELDVSLKGVKQKQFVHFRRDGYRDQKMVINPAEMDFRTTELQLDVTMEPLAALTTVAGRLTDTESLPVPGQILTMASSKLRTSYQAQSDNNGKYIFKDVEPGKDYRLQIRPRSGYLDKDINSLEVPDRGLNLDIVLEPVEQGELSGWMADLAGNPVRGFALNLHSRAVAGRSIRVVGDQQGFFSVQDFPVGEAVFSTNSYPVFSVQGILVSPEPEDPITVILDTGPHLLQGRVVDRLGEPVAAENVVLTWTHSKTGVQSSSSRKTTADQNGNFIFTGLGPGLHRLQVSAVEFIKAAVVKIDIGNAPGSIVVVLDDDT